MRAVRTGDLNSGRSLGCGCGMLQAIIECRIKHAHAPRGAKSPTWIAWRDAKRRYGERIRRKWFDRFETFLQDVGHKPSPNHRLHVQRGRPLLPSMVSWTLKRETTIPRNVTRAKRRVEAAEARKAQ